MHHRVFGFHTILNDLLLQMSLNLRNLKLQMLLYFKNNLTERNLTYKFTMFNTKKEKKNSFNIVSKTAYKYCIDYCFEY